MMPDKKKSYRQMNEELSEMLAWFEGEQVDLEQAVEKYEQTMKLLADMETYLKEAENRIKKISAKFE